MNKRQYSPLWKNVGIAVQIILTIVFVMSVYLLGALASKNVLNTNDLLNTDFIESGYYKELFREKLDVLISFLRLRGKFETEGEYNPEKIVNTLRYAKDGTILADTEGNRVVILAQDEEGNYSYSESFEPYEDEALDEIQNSQEEIQVRLSNYLLSDLVSWAKEGYSKLNGKIEEKYLPIGGMGIAQAREQNMITDVQAGNLYDALETTLSTIGEEAKLYKKGLNEFHTAETNLTYSYSESGMLIYSNIMYKESAEVSDSNAEEEVIYSMAGEESVDWLAYARLQGSYFYYDSMELKFRTNMSGIEDYFYNTLDGRISRLGRRASLMVAVDTDFAQADAFAEAENEYNSLHPWVLVSIISLVISLFGWVIALVYLTMAAGHGEDEGKIYLNIFDKIKTELFFGTFVILTVALIAMTLSVSEGNWGIPGMLVMAGVAAFIYDGLFISFYLSMVRRIKAGVLWEYSLLQWIARNMRRVMHTWKNSIRIIILYSIHILLLLVLAYGSFAQRSILAITFLLIVIGVDGILYLRDVVGQQEIMKGIEKITGGDLSYKLPMDNLHGDNRDLAYAVNSIGDGIRHAVDESTKNERMKADLVTNVSHDIKTPLTSIINYVNLLKIEPIENERMRDYINILDEKSQRLKQLTEDLVEASRISSGNITLQMTKLNFVELIYQTGGEFNEKFEAKDLTTITKLPKESAIILADGRRIWRVVENLYNNVAKYAMAHTRVYVTMEKTDHEVSFSIKNISEQELSVESSELTERFIRGDEARTTEGSGLGLSIAENLTTLMGGTFRIELDGDLFTAMIVFPLAEEDEEEQVVRD